MFHFAMGRLCVYGLLLSCETPAHSCWHLEMCCCWKCARRSALSECNARLQQKYCFCEGAQLLTKVQSRSGKAVLVSSVLSMCEGDLFVCAVPINPETRVPCHSNLKAQVVGFWLQTLKQLTHSWIRNFNWDHQGWKTSMLFMSRIMPFPSLFLWIFGYRRFWFRPTAAEENTTLRFDILWVSESW